MKQSEAINPRSVTFISYLLWSFPLSYILMLGTFYNLPIYKLASIFFSFFYIAHSIFAVFTGFALYKMRPYAWHLFVFHSFCMLIEQAWVAFSKAENNIIEIPLIFVSLAILGTLLLVKLELRVPYFSPKIAWWESDPRYKISVPSEMSSDNHFYRGDIMDISASGCFIKTKDIVRVENDLLIKFSIFDRKFECTGKAVWRTEGGVTHPRGIGVKFINLPKEMQTDLRNTVKKLKKLSRRFKTLRAEEKALRIEEKVRSALKKG